MVNTKYKRKGKEMGMKKSIRKMLHVVVAISMAMSLTACGKEKTDTIDAGSDSTAVTREASNIGESPELSGEITGKITVLTNRTDLVDNDFKRYADVFEERYPGTEVEFQAMEDYESDMSVLVNVGEMGDLCLIPASISSSDYENYFEPLGTDDKLAEFYMQEALISTSYDGIVYGLPSGCSVCGVAYNKKVFTEAGVDEIPKSSEEFLEALEKIKENTEAIPYYTNYHDSWALGQWQAYVGGASGDADYVNNIMCNDKEAFTEGKPAYEVYKLLYDIVEKGLCEDDPISSDWEACKEMINNGEIGCMVIGSWAVSQFKAAGSNGENIGYMPFPVTASDGGLYQSMSTDYAYAIPKSADNKPTAKAFMDFLINDTDYTEVQGMISIVRDVEYPEFLQDFEGMNLIVNNAANVDNKGKWEKVNQASELNLNSGSEYQIDIIDTALGQSHRSNETYEDIMKEWNDKWKDGIVTIDAQ